MRAWGKVWVFSLNALSSLDAELSSRKVRMAEISGKRSVDREGDGL
jgi:hypothetical protein